MPRVPAPGHIRAVPSEANLMHLRGLRAGRTATRTASLHPHRPAGARFVALALLLGATSLLMSGCTLFSSPQNTFAPAGEVAHDQRNLYLITMWPAVAIMILVEGMILFLVVRFRRRKTDTALPPQVHGNNRLEIAWTVAPIILLALFVVPVISGIVDLAKRPDNAVQIDVTGVQWAWQFSYQNPNNPDGPPIAGHFGDPLHVPVGEDVFVRLHSDNVIHSFWVPKLAGKIDVIPSRTNHMWFRGDEVGTFAGQCAEFCGLSHADMRFTVVVEPRADYDAYVGGLAAAQQPAASDQLARQGD